jgi:putative transcriptional regulator
MTTLAPTLLLSMPQLLDPNFNRTVILLCKHSANGAFGLVVNRPLVTSGRVVVNLGASGGSRASETIATDRELEVWIGGPVEPQRSWMLVAGEAGENVGEDLDEEGATGMRIANGLYLTTSPDLLRRMLEPDPPSNARFVIGYSGWGPGQLEAELEASAWLISDVDKDLIFTTPPERMWETAIRRLGADPAALQISRGVH